MMKRLFVSLVMCATVGTLSAQEPVRGLAAAQMEYDRVVTEQKRAVSEARSDERRVSDAANHRLEVAKSELQGTKERYKVVVAEQKRRVNEAKMQVTNASARYKQESARTKSEIAAAKSKTKSVVEEHKGRVAKAKAEISRIKAEEHERQVAARAKAQ